MLLQHVCPAFFSAGPDTLQAIRISVVYEQLTTVSTSKQHRTEITELAKAVIQSLAVPEAKSPTSPTSPSPAT